jgi:hypothetical protein
VVLAGAVHRFFCEAGKKTEVETLQIRGSEVLRFNIQTAGLQIKTQ